MKGYKLLARAAHENARMKNKDKDKLGGKEWKPGWDKSPEFRRTSDENILAVTPREYPGVTKSLSDKKLARMRRYAGFER